MRIHLCLIASILFVAAPVGAEPKKLVVEFTTLTLMRDKGVITEAEFQSAMHDLADSVGTQAGESTTLLLGKWSTTLYGFVETDLNYDTTQSFSDQPGNVQVARPDTFAGKHSRFTFAVRNSRIGF